MKIILPRTSGFCYGVSLAVKEAENVLNEGRRLIMFGEIVHNPDVVSALEGKGGITVDSVQDVENDEKRRDSVLLIRAHGVPEETQIKLGETGVELRDKTCPKVKKVHMIVKEEEEKGSSVVIVGNPKHPEVIGILGQCRGDARVISSPEEAEALVYDEKTSVVVQTTFNGAVFESIKQVIQKRSPSAFIYDTMCPATNIRQGEIAELSKTADYVIVLGGKKSSNSLKLCEIAKKHTESVLVEKIEEIDLEKIRGKEKVVVCGGSSTPYELIKDGAEYIASFFGAEITRL